MVKSPLATQVVDFGTKNSNPRTEKIIKITPHHMAGKTLADDCARYHRDSGRQASANYYIGYDGTICAGVSEDRRAWTSSSSWNDQRAITIEVSNSSVGGNWPISEKAYSSLVKLCADICNRYNIDPKYIGSKDGSITYHQMFNNTNCPGPWLLQKIQSKQFENDIKAAMEQPIPTPAPTRALYRVQTGAFSNKDNADRYMQKISDAGFDTYMVTTDGLYKVQCGAFSNPANAEKLADELEAAGFDTYITTQSGTAVKNSSAKRSIDEVALEVKAGKWGNDPERSRRLEAAGYDPKEVQRAVNKLYK